jgi:hypothetical protein
MIVRRIIIRYLDQRTLSSAVRRPQRAIRSRSCSVATARQCQNASSRFAGWSEAIHFRDNRVQCGSKTFETTASGVFCQRQRSRGTDCFSAIPAALPRRRSRGHSSTLRGKAPQRSDRGLNSSFRGCDEPCAERETPAAEGLPPHFPAEANFCSGPMLLRWSCGGQGERSRSGTGIRETGTPARPQPTQTRRPRHAVDLVALRLSRA